MFFAVYSCATRPRGFSADAPVCRSLSAVEYRLRAAANASPRIFLSVFGHVRDSEKENHLWAVTCPAAGKAEKNVLITAGIHGNEPAGVEAALSLIEEIAADPTLYPNITLRILPILNPWGWQRDQRFNGAGKDLNRDFASFETPEARIIKEWLQGKSFDLIVNIHEDPRAGGYYIYQYGRPDQALCRQIISQIRQNGLPIENNVSMMLLRTDDGLIDAPMWGLRYMRLTGQLSLDNYCRFHHTTEVYTLESPATRPLEERIHVHRSSLDMLIRR